jgi:lipoprotein-anchoring transpeptidase ErfK/SrfK
MKRLAALALGLGLLAGCGGGDGTQKTDAWAPGFELDIDPADDVKRETADIYFTAGEQFRKVERKVPAGPDERRIEAAARELLAGPTKREAATEVETTSQIPAGTELEDVRLTGDGTAVVAVSPEFTRGIPAASRRTRAEDSELDARLSQMTFTVTQFPQVDEAKVVAGGEPVERAFEPADFEQPDRAPSRVEHQNGRRGASVLRLQERLAELRYLPRSAVDGVDGYRTQQAVIAFQSWRGLERDGVVGPMTSAALAKASPPRPHANGPSRRIEVYREKGVTLLIRHDRTVRAIHVSSGSPGNETPAGRFEVFRKELRSWSVPFQTWLPYASYFNNGIAFHEYPDVPPYPASHGCVRVPSPEAKGVYRFAKLGTKVVVF